MTNHLPALIVVVPLITAVMIPLPAIRRHAAGIAVLSCGVVLAISGALLREVLSAGRVSYRFGGWEPPWGIEYAVDYLSGFVLVAVALIVFLCSVYAVRSAAAEIPAGKAPFFYSTFMLMVTGLLGIVVTGDIFNMYVFIEISSLSGYTLIAMGRRREALTASYNYLILGTIGATFILLGIGHLYMATGTLNMADLSRRLPGLYGSRVVLTAFAFFSVGLSLKLALFPLHTWLPNAYTYAPSVVSATLAATATKVGAYALMRVMFTVFDLRFDMTIVPFTKILLVLSSVAIVAGSAIAISQSNIKRMLAYSSVAQIGYIVLGAALANRSAMTGGLLHILNHALMKGGLFLVAGIVFYRTGIEDIDGLKGMGKKMPLTMAAFTVGGLSMVGVPLTVGFVSKWYLVLGALEAGMWYVAPVVLLSSLLTAVYFWRIIEGIYFGKPKEGIRPPMEAGPEAPLGMLAPTLVMAGLCIVFGIAASAPIYVAGRAAGMLLGGGG